MCVCVCVCVCVCGLWLYSENLTVKILGSVSKHVSSFVVFFFFLEDLFSSLFLYFWGWGGGERERERDRQTDRHRQTHTHTLRMSQWEGQRIRSGLCADSTDSPTHGSKSGTEPWDHDLSRSWMLN